MNDVLRWIASGVSVGAVGAAIAFTFSVVQIVIVRSRESRDREFDKYHSLIQQLVSPDEKGTIFLDRQIAVLFELRHFPRYFECTQRILSGLRETWGGNQGSSMLIQEIDLTLAYIKKKI
jgi:hypothetical protein